MEKTSNERLQELIDKSGLSQNEFANYIKVGIRTLEKYIGEDPIKINPSLTKKLSKAMPINLYWLLFGEGNMLTNSEFSFTKLKNSPRSIKPKPEAPEVVEEKPKKVPKPILGTGDLRIISRIIEERKRLKLTVEEWAYNLKIPVEDQIAHEKEQLKIGASYFESMYAALPVDIHYLLTGKRIFDDGFKFQHVSDVLADYQSLKNRLDKQQSLIDEFVDKLVKHGF